MQNQRGFIGLPILIAILLGVVVLGGGAYFVIQQKSSTQTASKIPDAEIPTNIQAQSDVTTETINNTQTIQTKPIKKQEDNVIASATLDSNPLKTSSTNPTISGTATGVSKIIVSLGDKGEIFWTSTPVSVVNGRWSVVGSIPQSALSSGTPQFSILVNASTNSQGTLPSLTTGTLVVTNSFTLPKLGNLFVTPQGTPTIQMPEGWKARVTDEDYPLKVQEKLAYITLVVFTNADHSRVFSYQLFASPRIIDESTGLDLAKEALSMDSNTTLISQKSVTLHGFPVNESLFRNVKKDLSTGEPLIYEAVARVFYIAPGFILVAGGSSTKEPASDILSWYNPIFESIVLPSFFNQYPNGIPIANFMNLKSKFDEMSNMATEAKAVPKGTPPDFFYSAACPTFTADMSLGDTDHNTGGQISLLQTLLFGKYNVTGSITGRFDDLTLVSTIRFQREMGLEGSGGVAEKTRAALARCRFSP